MSTGERLKKLIKEIGVKNSEFAESIGLSSGGLSDIISGRNKGISNPVVKAIQYKYNVNPTWLLTGEGGMFLSDAGNGGKPDVNFDKRGNPIVKYPTAEINPILGELTADEIVLIQSHRKMKAEMEKKSKKSS